MVHFYTNIHNLWRKFLRTNLHKRSCVLKNCVLNIHVYYTNTHAYTLGTVPHKETRTYIHTYTNTLLSSISTTKHNDIYTIHRPPHTYIHGQIKWRQIQRHYERPERIPFFFPYSIIMRLPNKLLCFCYDPLQYECFTFFKMFSVWEEDFKCYFCSVYFVC